MKDELSGFRVSQIKLYGCSAPTLPSDILRFPREAAMAKEDGKTCEITKKRINGSHIQLFSLVMIYQVQCAEITRIETQNKSS